MFYVIVYLINIFYDLVNLFSILLFILNIFIINNMWRLLCVLFVNVGCFWGHYYFYVIYLFWWTSCFLDIIWIRAGIKNPKILLVQNEFTINTKLGSRTRWRCNQYFKTKCKATLITYERTVMVKNFHNHVPTNPTLDKSIPKQVILSRQISDTSIPYVFGIKNNLKY